MAIKGAAAKGARLVNFCEGALSGYAKSQISHPDEWRRFDWEMQNAELHAIAELCGELNIFSVIGAAHYISDTHPPHNSLYVFADNGRLLTRYDKRYLSNTELGGWYTPGTEPVTFDVDGYRFGCAICIETQFPEIFAEYEGVAADAVLFASYGLGTFFDIALQAHAGINCLWISAATPTQTALNGASGIIGPDGKWIARCHHRDYCDLELIMTTLDRNDALFNLPLKKSRPWRVKARSDDIYRGKRVEHSRSRNRDEF